MVGVDFEHNKDYDTIDLVKSNTTITKNTFRMNKAVEKVVLVNNGSTVTAKRVKLVGFAVTTSSGEVTPR